jgi:antitoxin CptB
MIDDQTKFIKNLIFQSSHRGMKELDLILGNFATTTLPYLNNSLQQDYALLLQQNDDDLWKWLSGQQLPPLPLENIIFEIIKT